MSREFDEFWRRLTEVLRDKQLIRNWTRDSGYLGGDFYAVYLGGNAITCILDSGSVLEVPKKDFELLFNHWEDYINGRYPRHLLRDKSRFTKYTISILINIGNSYRNNINQNLILRTA
ncbi:MAG: hypothetical protein ACTSR0_00995 [Candidatus Asgardarchaeia archaeon]